MELGCGRGPTKEHEFELVLAGHDVMVGAKVESGRLEWNLGPRHNFPIENLFVHAYIRFR
jgi:hypothetical protein